MLVVLGAAVHRLARKFLHDALDVVLAIAAAVAIALGAPFPVVLLVAASAGLVRSHVRPGRRARRLFRACAAPRVPRDRARVLVAGSCP